MGNFGKSNDDGPSMMRIKVALFFFLVGVLPITAVQKRTKSVCQLAFAKADQNEDGRLGRNFEYVVFVNLLSGDLFGSATFSELPQPLRSTFDGRKGRDDEVHLLDESSQLRSRHLQTPLATFCAQVQHSIARISRSRESQHTRNLVGNIFSPDSLPVDAGSELTAMSTPTQPKPQPTASQFGESDVFAKQFNLNTGSGFGNSPQPTGSPTALAASTMSPTPGTETRQPSSTPSVTANIFDQDSTTLQPTVSSLTSLPTQASSTGVPTASRTDENDEPSTIVNHHPADFTLDDVAWNSSNFTDFPSYDFNESIVPSIEDSLTDAPSMEGRDTSDFTDVPSTDFIESFVPSIEESLTDSPTDPAEENPTSAPTFTDSFPANETETPTAEITIILDFNESFPLEDNFTDTPTPQPSYFDNTSTDTPTVTAEPLNGNLTESPANGQSSSTIEPTESPGSPDSDDLLGDTSDVPTVAPTLREPSPDATTNVPTSSMTLGKASPVTSTPTIFTTTSTNTAITVSPSVTTSPSQSQSYEDSHVNSQWAEQPSSMPTLVMTDVQVGEDQNETDVPSEELSYQDSNIDFVTEEFTVEESYVFSTILISNTNGQYAEDISKGERRTIQLAFQTVINDLLDNSRRLEEQDAMFYVDPTVTIEKLIDASCPPDSIIEDRLCQLVLVRITLRRSDTLVGFSEVTREDLLVSIQYASEYGLLNASLYDIFPGSALSIDNGWASGGPEEEQIIRIFYSFLVTSTDSNEAITLSYEDQELLEDAFTQLILSFAVDLQGLIVDLNLGNRTRRSLLDIYFDIQTSQASLFRWEASKCGNDPEDTHNCMTVFLQYNLFLALPLMDNSLLYSWVDSWKDELQNMTQNAISEGRLQEILLRKNNATTLEIVSSSQVVDDPDKIERPLPSTMSDSILSDIILTVAIVVFMLACCIGCCVGCCVGIVKLFERQRVDETNVGTGKNGATKEGVSSNSSNNGNEDVVENPSNEHPGGSEFRSQNEDIDDEPQDGLAGTNSDTTVTVRNDKHEGDRTRKTSIRKIASRGKIIEEEQPESSVAAEGAGSTLSKDQGEASNDTVGNLSVAASEHSNMGIDLQTMESKIHDSNASGSERSRSESEKSDASSYDDEVQSHGSRSDSSSNGLAGKEADSHSDNQSCHSEREPVGSDRSYSDDDEADIEDQHHESEGYAEAADDYEESDYGSRSGLTGKEAEYHSDGQSSHSEREYEESDRSFSDDDEADIEDQHDESEGYAEAADDYEESDYGSRSGLAGEEAEYHSDGQGSHSEREYVGSDRSFSDDDEADMEDQSEGYEEAEGDFEESDYGSQSGHDEQYGSDTSRSAADTGNFSD